MGPGRHISFLEISPDLLNHADATIMSYKWSLIWPLYSDIKLNLEDEFWVK